MTPLSPITISCQVEGCAWEMEDFLPTGNPMLLHPLLAAYASHHTIEAHPDMLEEILEDQEDHTPEMMLAECRDVFEDFGIDPDDPYEYMDLTFQ